LIKAEIPYSFHPAFSIINKWLGVDMLTRIVLKGLSVSAFLAISANLGWAGCINPPLNDKAISEFQANPKAIVFPDADTRTIEAMTRDLAGTDASLAAGLVRVAASAAPRFRTAIAAGLAQAAMACASIDQKAAELIQEAVAGYDDGQFQASFAAVAGDLSTAATAAAGASAASSEGSVVITNPNSSPRTAPPLGGGGSSVPTQLTSTAIPFNTPTTIGASNGNSASNPTTALETNAAQPVSQTR
jgi:hypothetical protein